MAGVVPVLFSKAAVTPAVSGAVGGVWTDTVSPADATLLCTWPTALLTLAPMMVKATALELAPVDLVTVTSTVTKSPVICKSLAGIWAVTWLELM